MSENRVFSPAPSVWNPEKFARAFSRAVLAGVFAFFMWLFPLPAMFAPVGCMGEFIAPGLQPGGWKYTVDSCRVYCLILAWHKRE